MTGVWVLFGSSDQPGTRDAPLKHGKPERLKASARESAKRLATETICVYQLYRPDPPVSFKEALGALFELMTNGLITTVGYRTSRARAWRLRNQHAERRRRGHTLSGVSPRVAWSCRRDARGGRASPV